ncbi:MAG: multicopper oxidase domain-containing protein [Pseudomonadales bacterium]|nr:multicopper oxidase domain-containing protein [Pseudomonadales bacterium]
MLSRVVVFYLLLLSLPLYAKTVSYDLTIESTLVNVTGVEIQGLSVSGQIPAPTLRAEVGDTLQVSFTNLLDEPSSIHWHGILLPPDQDGVPELNTRPILPGETLTFEFDIRHTGTYWYHSHTELQIQRGVYGSIVLSDPAMQSPMQEATVLFSDWIDDDADDVLANLKKNDEFYAYKKNAVQSWDKVLANGPQAISNRINSAITRMGPMDLADVAYDAFLVNGARESILSVDNPRAESMKLRLVNGSTSSYFDVEYAGGPMTVISADGQNVEPIRVQRLRISTAETYDVLVPLQAGKAFELRANSFDGSGYSSLFVGEGERVRAPDVPPPNLYLMNHMDMGMAHDMGSAETMSMHSMPVETTAHQHDSGHDMSMMQPDQAVIAHMTDYRYLMTTEDTSLPSDRPWREIPLTLTGSMERYVWSFDGRTAREDAQIVIRPDENVRIHLSNDTMMHHPLHLHGHFFRVVNQHGERSPLKHTVNVPPMGSVIIEFDANESQDWLFHCHNQYHMKAGMNRVISYDDSSLFTDQIDRRMQPANRWFYLNEFHLMSSFGDYEFRVADDRHSFEMELDTDLEHAYELHLLYNYHFNQFFSLFAGFEKRHEHNERTHDKAIAGFNLTLPFLIESEWRFDDHGDFRVELESEIQLTRRWAFDWRWNTDDEHRYGFNYRLNNRFAITVHTDTEYGEGIGVQFYY